LAGRRRKSRGLSPEDKALWQKVAEQAIPLARPLPDLAEMLDNQPDVTPPVPVDPPLKPFKIGSKPARYIPVNMLKPGFDQGFAAVSSNMDKRNFERLKKGKLAVDGRIDLHGMTLAQAHPALNNFVRDAYHSGKRLLLVITGKGCRTSDESIMPERRGVLKRQVPQWLNQPPLSPLVLQVTEASRKHGGGGAYYVYLRRQR